MMIADPRRIQQRISFVAATALGLPSETVGLRAEGFSLPNAQMAPVAWHEIDGWADDDHAAAFATFLNSCKAVLKGSPGKVGRPMYNALHEVCEQAVTLKSPDAKAAREFF